MESVGVLVGCCRLIGTDPNDASANSGGARLLGCSFRQKCRKYSLKKKKKNSDRTFFSAVSPCVSPSSVSVSTSDTQAVPLCVLSVTQRLQRAPAVHLEVCACTRAAQTTLLRLDFNFFQRARSQTKSLYICT